MILGIDEVGRGAWAGPLVVGAVVLGDSSIAGLTDSKLLSKKRREQFAQVIKATASGYGLGWVSAGEIDQIGLAEALRLATIRAVEQVKTSYHEIIIDGTINFLSETTKGSYVTVMKKADVLVPSVSAASILAKVARDDYMATLDESYPDHQFSRHVGYGTALHRQAIADYGPTEYHRYSFAPLAGLAPATRPPRLTSTKSKGDRAEKAVSEYLKQQGHTILDRNWKNRFCEIDIISLYDDTLYFTEVKYRASADQGGGLSAITAKKLRQMAFASDLYVTKQLRLSKPRQLAVAAVGKDFRVETWLKID